MKLKIISYNIHKGFNWLGFNYVLDEIRELIVSHNADLVLLQEVVGENEKLVQKGLVDRHLEFFSDSIWQHHAYAKNAVYAHGHHGNLILSKYPIINSQNTDISTNQFEKRGLLSCEIEIPEAFGKRVHLLCSHLNLLHGGRNLQYGLIKNEIEKLGKESSIILGGDFNDWNQRASDVFENQLFMVEMHKNIHGEYAKSYPALYPLLKLDRLYVQNVKILNCYTLNHSKVKYMSDHCPLYGEIEI